MAENITILKGAVREEQYENLLPQLQALLGGESDSIANLANLSAALMHTFKFLWVGFYIVKSEQLVLGPFQGGIACTRIRFGKGVCGTAWKEKRTLIVPNVKLFDGHIACDSNSLSEVVVPIFDKDEVVAVLDVDSAYENYFSAVDAHYLEQIVKNLKIN